MAVAMDLKPADQLLVYGSGYGAELRYWCEVYGIKKIVAIDRSQQCCFEAKALMAPFSGVQVVHGDQSTALNQRFDGVIILDALYHFSNKERFFNGLRQILAVGGKVGFTDLTCESSWIKWHPRLWVLLRLMGVPVTELKSKNGYETLLNDLGYNLVVNADMTHQVLQGFVDFIRTGGDERAALFRRQGRLKSQLTASFIKQLRQMADLRYSMMVAAISE